MCNRGIKASMGDGLLAKPLLASDMVEVRVDSSATELKEITTKIYAGGICCPSEVPLIHRILTPMPGVLKVRLLAFFSLLRHIVLLKGSAMLSEDVGQFHAHSSKRIYRSRVKSRYSGQGGTQGLRLQARTSGPNIDFHLCMLLPCVTKEGVLAALCMQQC